jgi:sensor histidine kinase YesM
MRLFEKLVADVSFTALRSQMNPHFIFNCLNSIKLYTAQNDKNSALEYLTKFSKLIRLIMENSRTDKIPLASELTALKLYIELEAMRFKEKLQYNIHVDKDVEIDYIEIPPLLLQPYVENAIWHGLMHKEEGGKIDVDITMVNAKTTLQINITDNGIGRRRSAELKSKTATAHKSYGMKVTSERLELINHMYKTGAEVKIFDLTDENNNSTGTTIIILIPV